MQTEGFTERAFALLDPIGFAARAFKRCGLRAAGAAFAFICFL